MTATPQSLTVFVPTRLVNPTNTSEHWSKRSQRTARQREAVAVAVWMALRNELRKAWTIEAPPERPKRVTLTGHVTRKFDSDGLQAALKAIRDGLQDCRLIHSDGPDSGHEFLYDQTVSTPLGVTIHVELR